MVSLGDPGGLMEVYGMGITGIIGSSHIAMTKHLETGTMYEYL